MKHPQTLLAIPFLALCAAGAAADHEWRVDLAEDSVHNIYLRRGDATQLRAELYVRGREYIPSAAVAKYRTNLVDQTWLQAPAVVDGNTVSFSWTPFLAPGADVVPFAFYIDGEIYRAAAMIYLRASPDAGADEARAVLDLDAYDVTNAPWATPADLAAAIDNIAFPSPDWSVATNYTDVAATAATNYTAAAVAAAGAYTTAVSNQVHALSNALGGAAYKPADYYATNGNYQSAISDLGEIRAGAAAGATAVQNVLTAALPSGVGSGNDIGGWISMADQFLGTLPYNEAILTATYDGGDITRGYNGASFTSLSINGSQIVTSSDPRLSDARQPTEHTHTAGQVTGLATVATSGSYNDLTDKPQAPVETDPVALPLIAAAALAATNYTDSAIAAIPSGGGADMTAVSNAVSDLMTAAVAENPVEPTLEVLRLAVAELWESHDKLAGLEAYDDIADAIDAMVHGPLTNYPPRTEVSQNLAGYVPNTRKVNNKALSANITLSAADVGALSASGYSAISPADIGSDSYIYVEFYGSTRILSYTGTGLLEIGGLYAPNGPPCHLVLSGFSSVSWPSLYPIVDGTYDSASMNYYEVGSVNGQSYVRFLFSF